MKKDNKSVSFPEKEVGGYGAPDLVRDESHDQLLFLVAHN